MREKNSPIRSLTNLTFLILETLTNSDRTSTYIETDLRLFPNFRKFKINLSDKNSPKNLRMCDEHIAHIFICMLVCSIKTSNNVSVNVSVRECRKTFDNESNEIDNNRYPTEKPKKSITVTTTITEAKTDAQSPQKHPSLTICVVA